MGLLNWLGRQIKLTDTSFWQQFLLQESYAGKCVNADSALTISSYWACVRLIAQSIGTLPLLLYERGEDNSRTIKSSEALYTILHDQPNGDQTACEFWEGATASLCVWGNSYALKEFNASARGSNLSALRPLATLLVNPYRNKDGDLIYRFTDRNKVEEYPEEKIFHIRGFGFGGDVGLSPISYARQTLGNTLATDEAAARMFSNGMRPGGFFTFPKLLSPEQRTQAKKALIEPYIGAENAYKIGILEAGVDWKNVVIPPEDAQLLQSRSFNVEETCRWFGVPPIMVGHASAGQTMWGSGVEQILIGWLTLGLRPYLSRIEQAIKRSLLTPEQRRTLYAEFIVEGLLRGDAASRATFYSTLAQNGILTRNEIRAKENLSRSSEEGADALTVQVNLVPISKLGTDRVASQSEARRFGGPRDADAAEGSK
jgi:HK97 family phage portal protein